MSEDLSREERLEQATSARLAKLAGTCVNTSSVERRLQIFMDEQITPQPTVLAKLGPSIRNIAAVIIFCAALVLMFLNTNTSPVIASSAEMTRVYHEVAAGTDTVAVGSYDQVHNAILTKWVDSPVIPKPTVGQITACCLHKLEQKEVVCVAMEYMGQVVTMAVGHSRDLVCGAAHNPLERNGKTYLIHQGDDLQMVMIEHSGRWVCIMSKLGIDDLVTLADGLEF